MHRCVVCLCDIQTGQEKYYGAGPLPRCPTCYERVNTENRTMHKYDVYVQVYGWVRIGEVEARNYKEATRLGRQLDYEMVYDKKELEDDDLEACHPMCMEVKVKEI